MSSWYPSASLSVIQQRAALYHVIRQFFLDHQVLELDVPVLSSYATVDPYIDSISAQVMGQVAYLQTSPEFFMKRFLAAHAHDVYYLGKAFRQDERGSHHRPEFTMLEWYRLGWDEYRLMDEVKALVLLCDSAIHPLSDKPPMHDGAMTYRTLFETCLGINPHTATVSELRECAHNHIDIDFQCEEKSPWLDLLFTHCLEPKLPSGLVTIYNYPAAQAALAEIAPDEHGHMVAKRFELYLNGVELANGYYELVDGEEQKRRFLADQHYRRQQGLLDYPYDQTLVNALQQGAIPQCAGVAVGVDRLLMGLLGKDNIKDVLIF
jgi:lysyl-tRNA synthetase class 2